MKAIGKYSILIFALVIAVYGCNNNRNRTTESGAATVDAAHNARNSLDYEGVYTGVIPCADCEGIRLELTLRTNTYSLRMEYLGKGADNVYTETGNYTWNSDGNVITLDQSEPNTYQVAENQLFILDDNGNRITGDLEAMYILRKRPL